MLFIYSSNLNLNAILKYVDEMAALSL